VAPRYRLDPGNSRLTVHAFATGLLSFLGHSPTFVVRDVTGQVRFDPASPELASLEVVARADSLELLDRVKPADRDDIEGRMRHEVLQTNAYPEVRYEAAGVTAQEAGAHQYRLRMNGRMSLHGVTSRQPVDALLEQYTDGIRLGGEFDLALSDYHIRSVTALGGAIRLQDRLRVAFDLVAWKEGP
jgi:polyisoprenoid-binding protein YceI